MAGKKRLPIRQQRCSVYSCRGNSRWNQYNAQSRRNGRSAVNYLQKIGLLMLLLVTGAYTNSAFAQETPKQEALKASGSGSATGEIQSERNLQGHHFWDRENGWLFAGVGAARARLFLDLEYAPSRQTGDFPHQRRRGQSSCLRYHRGRRNGNFHWRFVLLPSLRSSQARALDFVCAHRPCDHGLGPQLLPQDGPPEDHAVTLQMSERT